MENWLKTAIGKSLDPDRTYGLQCKDVIDDYAMALWPGKSWIETVKPVIGAKSVYNAAPEAFWFKTLNDPHNTNQVPQRGDVIVWNGNLGGGDGHIAVVLSAGANGFTVIEQDGFKKVPAYQKFYSNYSNVIGWMTPRINQATINQPLGGDMVTRSGLEHIFRDKLERMPDESAYSHYVGKYTYDFVLSDIENSSERREVWARRDREKQESQKELSDLRGQLTDKGKLITALTEDHAKETNRLNNRIKELELVPVSETKPVIDKNAPGGKSVRTFIQALIGLYALLAPLFTLPEVQTLITTKPGWAMLPIAGAALTAIVTYLQNKLEESKEK